MSERPDQTNTRGLLLPTSFGNASAYGELHGGGVEAKIVLDKTPSDYGRKVLEQLLGTVDGLQSVEMQPVDPHVARMLDHEFRKTEDPFRPQHEIIAVYDDPRPGSGFTSEYLGDYPIGLDPVTSRMMLRAMHSQRPAFVGEQPLVEPEEAHVMIQPSELTSF